MAGEFDFIRWIMSQSAARPASAGPQVLVQPGDDLAVLKWDAPDLLVIGVDQVLDGVHFDSRIHSPQHIGRKVMNRNLSDCAAMACLPAAAVATAALPRGSSLDYAKQLYAGMSDAGAAFDCSIVGGDTASWDGKLVLTLSILGRSAGINPITRAGAKAGDGIYVTGPLGGSILGRHMTFTPRITLARELATIGINAMIDISDGLSRDLGHICDLSHVGAIIEADLVPIHADAIALAQTDGRSPLDHALNDGEDHELLFAAAVNHSSRAIRIGMITAEAGMRLKHVDGGTEELERRGFEHSL